MKWMNHEKDKRKKEHSPCTIQRLYSTPEFVLKCKNDKGNKMYSSFERPLHQQKSLTVSIQRY